MLILLFHFLKSKTCLVIGLIVIPQLLLVELGCLAEEEKKKQKYYLRSIFLLLFTCFNDDRDMVYKFTICSQKHANTHISNTPNKFTSRFSRWMKEGEQCDADGRAG